jgi:hypothetical protein
VTLEVIDELDVNLFVTTEHRHTWTLYGAAYLFTDAHLDALTAFCFERHVGFSNLNALIFASTR